MGNAGQTTILNKLKLNEVSKYPIPTICFLFLIICLDFNVETIEYSDRQNCSHEIKFLIKI